MVIKRSWIALLLVLVLTFSCTAPVEAGIMDSIKGFFSKASDTVKGWFSGGGTKEFEELLQQVVSSQEVVAEKQNDILDKVSRSGNSSLSPTDPEYQTAMDELAEASRANEELYTNLLNVRQELVDGKKDVTAYEENFARIQETQHNLEEGFQALQNASREEGAFTPPSDVASANGAMWADPKVQKYMDEWLAANGLDEFGRLIGGVVVAVADPDMDGRSREQWLWEEMFNNRGSLTGSTLESYVKSRMNGGAAAVAGSVAVATGNSGGSQIDDRSSSTASVASGSTVSASVPGGASLADTDAQLKTAMASYEKMAADGRGNSDYAAGLLEDIKVLKAQRDAMISQGTAASQ